MTWNFAKRTHAKTSIFRVRPPAKVTYAYHEHRRREQGKCDGLPLFWAKIAIIYVFELGVFKFRGKDSNSLFWDFRKVEFIILRVSSRGCFLSFSYLPPHFTLFSRYNLPSFHAKRVLPFTRTCVCLTSGPDEIPPSPPTFSQIADATPDDMLSATQVRASLQSQEDDALTPTQVLSLDSQTKSQGEAMSSQPATDESYRWAAANLANFLSPWATGSRANVEEKDEIDVVCFSAIISVFVRSIF